MSRMWQQTTVASLNFAVIVDLGLTHIICSRFGPSSSIYLVFELSFCYCYVKIRQYIFMFTIETNWRYSIIEADKLHSELRIHEWILYHVCINKK
jgi:hypothetical protein